MVAKQRKAQANQQLMLIIASLIVAFSFIYYVSNGGFKGLTGSLVAPSYSGGVVLSVSPTQLIINNSFISSNGDNRVWEGTVAITGQGQQLVAGNYTNTQATASATLNPTQSSIGGATPTNNININYALTSESCNYQAVNSNNILQQYSIAQPSFNFSILNGGFLGIGATYTYSYPSYDNSIIYGADDDYVCSGNTCMLTPEGVPITNIWASSFKQACNNAGGVWATGTASDGTAGLACIVATPSMVGTVYNLQTPIINYAVQLSLNNGVSPQEVLSLSQSQSSAISSDNNVYALLSNGGLASTSYCPSVSTMPVVLVTPSGSKYFIKNLFQNPSSAAAYTFTPLSNGNLGSTDVANIYNFNSLVTSEKGSLTNTGLTVSNQSNQLTVSYDNIANNNIVFYPIIQVFAKAQWMGILIPEIHPAITTTSCPNFQSGTTGVLTVGVQSLTTSTTTGSIQVSANCPGVSVTNSPQLVTGLTPGASGVATLLLSGATQTSQCSITASDPNNPSNSVSSTATCNIQPACTLFNHDNWVVVNPTSSTCSYQCTLTSSDCTSVGKTLDSANCQCVVQPGVGNGCAYNNPSCPTSETCQYNTCVVTSCPTGQALVNGACVTPTPPTPPTPTQPNNNLLYAVIAIIIIIIAIIGVSYYGYKKGWF